LQDAYERLVNSDNKQMNPETGVLTALAFVLPPAALKIIKEMTRNNVQQHRFNYDDSLDVFGVHGIGGMTGTLLVGVFATSAIGGTAGLIEGHPQQVLIQLYGIAVTLAW